MKRLSVRNINKAAFYTLLGGKVIKIEGKNPDNTFILDVSEWVLQYEKYIGLVRYRKYVAERMKLKEMCRRRQGLPAHYTTRKKLKFKFKDIMSSSGRK